MLVRKLRQSLWVTGLCCTLSLLFAPGTGLWAQTPPQENPPPEDVTVSPDEESLVDPNVPADLPVDPPPEDEYDLNDQGAYDPAKGDFVIYMGDLGHWKPWSHHKHYVRKAENWYCVLHRTPGLAGWFNGGLAGLEIRYWYDPLPGPLSYSAHARVWTHDDYFLADVYAMNETDLEYRLGELELLFGRPVLLTETCFTCRGDSDDDGEDERHDKHKKKHNDDGEDERHDKHKH